jgi:hypothetical protein
MELRQSSFVSSILPSSQTRWKFWTIRAFGTRRGLVLDDAVVGIVFVAMIDVVEWVKMLLFYIECWNVFSWFFCLFSLECPTRFCCLYYHTNKTKLPRRNSLTMKERQKSEKNNGIYIASSVWMYDHTWNVSLSLSFSSFRIAHSKKIHITRNPKSDYFMADKKLAPETD